MAVSIIEDKVWFDEKTKLAQVCDDVANARLSGHSVLLLSFFEATLARLSTQLREKSVSHDPLDFRLWTTSKRPTSPRKHAGEE